MNNLYSFYFRSFEKLFPLMPLQNDFVPGISDCFYNVLYIQILLWLNSISYIRVYNLEHSQLKKLCYFLSALTLLKS